MIYMHMYVCKYIYRIYTYGHTKDDLLAFEFRKSLIDFLSV